MELSDAAIAGKRDSGKVLCASLSAAPGALGGAPTDFGIKDAVMKELSCNLQLGGPALFVLIHKKTTDKELDAIKGTGGTVLKTSLTTRKNWPCATRSQSARVWCVTRSCRRRAFILT